MALTWYPWAGFSGDLHPLMAAAKSSETHTAVDLPVELYIHSWTLVFCLFSMTESIMTVSAFSYCSVVLMLRNNPNNITRSLILSSLSALIRLISRFKVRVCILILTIALRKCLWRRLRLYLST